MSGIVASRGQLARLLQVLLALRSGRALNTRELAETCEVSRRTIFRDLGTLQAAGIPIRYCPEHQGYELAADLALEPPRLEEKEVAALWVLAQGQRDGSAFGLRREARNGVRKLIQALPAESREKMLSLAEAVRDQPEPVAPTPERVAVWEALLEALWTRRQIRLWYREGNCPPDPDESTKLSPYRLLSIRNRWYVIGRSTLHRRVQTFRVAGIQRAVLTEDPYAIPPRFRLDRYLGAAWEVERGPDRFETCLRFSASIAPLVPDLVSHPSRRLETLEDGRLDLHLHVEGLDEILPWILGFGDQVEVLAPLELRRRVFETARRIAHLYTPKPHQGAQNDQGQVPEPSTPAPGPDPSEQ